jgi:hypothetical protein
MLLARVTELYVDIFYVEMGCSAEILHQALRHFLEKSF